MQLSRFPRRRYTPHPTELVPLRRLSSHLGGPTIWLKRDDQLGLAGGGNKARKLEFLVADALERGADTLVTTGAVQSNHCRMTLAAARQEGLACRLVSEERVPGSYDEGASGNNLLFRLLDGERVAVVPAGADVAAAEELMTQADAMGLVIDRVVVASGSGGTHAGLVAGLTGLSSGVPVIGISTRADEATQAAKILDLARRTAALAGSSVAVRPEDVIVRDGYVGPGYSLPTDGMVEAVRLFARLEGVLLDPVYSGKAAAGLIDLVRRGELGSGEDVVLVHTGGWPALFAYRDYFGV